MNVDVVALPKDLLPSHIDSRTVVVFDVLRATTTMTAALAAGVELIRIFPDCEAARLAASDAPSPRPLLCGEVKCLPPEGFDLGNSPGGLDAVRHAGKTLYMSTTNGTRAVIAARRAPLLLAGALVNAGAVARALKREGRDATLLCAGTDGQVAMEDLMGAGAVIAGLENVTLGSDLARIALRLFQASREILAQALAQSAGGQNVIRAGLPEDVFFCAEHDRFDVVGQVLDEPLRLIRHGA